MFAVTLGVNPLDDKDAADDRDKSYALQVGGGTTTRLATHAATACMGGQPVTLFLVLYGFYLPEQTHTEQARSGLLLQDGSAPTAVRVVANQYKGSLTHFVKGRKCASCG